MHDMRYTIHLVYVTTFLFLFGESLQPTPRIAIYEDVVCRQHYAKSPDDVRDCKIPAVQEELALLGGIERVSLVIPSLLAIPFAALADRYGHALVLAIALFGLFLEESWPMLICWFPDVFPIRLIWLHFLFSLIGGGITVAVTLLHVIVADLVDADLRTVIFFRMRAAGVGASVLGYAAAGASMKANIWLPWEIGLLSLLLATASAILMKTTIPQPPPTSDTKVEESWRDWIRSSLQFLKYVAILLTGNTRFIIVLIVAFFCQLGFDSVPLMMAIYISKKFGWSFANASFLSSLEMGLELITLLLVLPIVTHLLTRWKISPFSKDLYIARASVAVLAAGTLSLGFAPAIGVAIAGIVVMSIGTGQDSCLRSIVTDMIDPSDISIAYSAITMLRAIGVSVSGPMYAGLYASGLRIEGVWVGLPFILAGIIFSTALLLLTFLKDNSGYEPVSEVDSEGH